MIWKLILGGVVLWWLVARNSTAAAPAPAITSSGAAPPASPPISTLRHSVGNFFEDTGDDNSPLTLKNPAATVAVFSTLSNTGGGVNGGGGLGGGGGGVGGHGHTLL